MQLLRYPSWTRCIVIGLVLPFKRNHSILVRTLTWEHVSVPSATLSSQLLRSAPDGDHRVVAALVLSISWLQGCEQLHEIPTWLAASIDDEVKRLPPQHSPQLDAHPAAGWLLLVSLADSIAAFDVARGLLDEIERLNSEEAERPSPGAVLCATSRSTFNLRALSSARRGRLSRQQGDLASAAQWYRTGLRLLRGFPREDGWATCTLGLAIIAQSVGNFPLTMRYCRTVLRAEATIGKHSLYGAHLTLAVAHRRRGELQRALHHAWIAFELAEGHDGDRQQSLINVAEISLRLGQAAAARNGFKVVMQHEQPERNRIPAHVGLLESETVLWQARGNADSTVLQQGIVALLADARRCRQPFERIKGLLGALDAAVTIGWTDQAQLIDSAIREELAAATSLGTRWHEFEFRHAAIVARLAASTVESGTRLEVESDGVGPARISTRTRETVERLTALTATADVT